MFAFAGHARLYGLQRLATQALLLPADLQPQVLWRADNIRLGIHTDDGGDIHAYYITGESRQATRMDGGRIYCSGARDCARYANEPCVAFRGHCSRLFQHRQLLRP